jgi:DNA-binding response OmpR family regulator
MRETIEKQKILVVEDEADIRQVLSFFLKQAGFDILAVVGGQEAIDNLPAYRPDLVVLDILMRPVSGWQVLEWVRTRHADPALPVLILTALAQFSHQMEGLERGATEYITKPMQPRHVVERVQDLLSQSAEQQRLHRQSGMNERREVLEHFAAMQREELL